jgi:hypothetical protein
MRRHDPADVLGKHDQRLGGVPRLPGVAVRGLQRFGGMLLAHIVDIGSVKIYLQIPCRSSTPVVHRLTSCYRLELTTPYRGSPPIPERPSHCF